MVVVIVYNVKVPGSFYLGFMMKAKVLMVICHVMVSLVLCAVLFIKVFIREVLIVVCHETVIISSKRVLSVETKKLGFPLVVLR